jgi:hypothetical protein
VARELSASAKHAARSEELVWKSMELSKADLVMALTDDINDLDSIV